MSRAVALILGFCVLAALPAWADAVPPATLPAAAAAHGDSCFGDRYESDADLNDGNEISDREIRELLRQLNRPSA